jgi:hypothetical protein
MMFRGFHRVSTRFARRLAPNLLNDVNHLISDGNSPAPSMLGSRLASPANLISSSGVQCSGRLGQSDSGSEGTGHGAGIQGSARKVGGTIALGVIALIAASVVLGSWYTVDHTQRAVRLRNSVFVEVVQPGLHFKIPRFESITNIEMPEGEAPSAV